MGWSSDAVAVIDDDATPPAPEEPTLYSTDPENRFRGSFLPEGRLLLEKNCGKCKKGWRKKWKLRIAGQASNPPLITENRVYFGAPDNRVYSLQRSNGYRLWDVDIGGRLSKPLMLWVGSVTEGDPDDVRELIIALPDGGARIIALDARSGQEVARFELPPDSGRIRGEPITTPDGSIVVAREKYNVEDASLMVLELSATVTIAEADPTVTPEGEVADVEPTPTGLESEAPPGNRQKKQ